MHWDDPVELRRHGAWLRALALDLAGEGAADDLVQDTWVAYLSQPERSLRSPRAWFATVLGNLARMRHRSEVRREAREASRARPEAEESPDRDADQRALREALIAAVFRLEPLNREIVVRRYFDGHAPAAVARDLGLTGAAVRSRLHRALQQLRRELDGGDSQRGRPWLAAVPAFVGRPDQALVRAVSVPSVGAASLLVLPMLKYSLTAGGLLVSALLLWSLAEPPPPAPAAPADASGMVPPVTAGLDADIDPPEGAATGGLRAPAAAEATQDALTLLVRLRCEGEPVAGRRVDVRLPKRPPESDEDQGVGWTDAAGEVRFEGIAPGAVVSSRQSFGRVRDAVPVAGEDFVCLEIEVAQGYWVEGRVVDPGGVVVPAASIHGYRGAGAESPHVLARSDAQGRFRLRADGESVFEARVPGYQVAYSRLLEPPRSGARVETTIQLGAPGASVTGRVLRPDGAPAAGAQLSLYLDTVAELRRGNTIGRNFERCSVADSDGLFVFDSLPPGRGLVVAGPDQGTSWVARGDVDLRQRSNLECALHGRLGAAVEVKVLAADGRGVPDAPVSVRFEATPLASDPLLSRRIRTGDDGQVVLHGLLPGLHTLQTFLNGQRLEQTVDVVAGGKVLSVLQLAPALDLEIEVVSSAAESPKRWTLLLRNLTVGREVVPYLQEQTDREGRAHFSLLDQDADYKLQVFRHEWSRFPVKIIERLDPTSGTVRVVIDPASFEEASVRGCFAVDPPPSGSVEVTQDGGAWQKEFALDGDGSFHVDSLPPAKYRIRLSSPTHFAEPIELRLGPGEERQLGALDCTLGCLPIVRIEPAAALAEDLRVFLRQEDVWAEQLFQNPGDRAIWQGSRPTPPGDYDLVVYGARIAPVSHPVSLRGGAQQLELPALQAGTPVRIDLKLQDHNDYGVLARGSLWIRGQGVEIGEAVFAHFDDRSERLKTLRYGLAPGTYRVEANGVKGRAELELEVGTEPVTAELVVR